MKRHTCIVDTMHMKRTSMQKVMGSNPSGFQFFLTVVICTEHRKSHFVAMEIKNQGSVNTVAIVTLITIPRVFQRNEISATCEGTLVNEKIQFNLCSLQSFATFKRSWNKALARIVARHRNLDSNFSC